MTEVIVRFGIEVIGATGAYLIDLLTALGHLGGGL